MKYFLIFFLFFLLLESNSNTIEEFKTFDKGSIVKKNKINKYVKYFSKNKKGRDFFVKAYSKIKLYENTIYKIFYEYDIPKEIIFVSMLESGFNPRIESSAGAVGLWQFMPSTGKIFDLQIDDWVDDRQDIEKSTLAAVKYFKSLRKKFRTWELALAGYNSGDLTVKRAVEKENSYDFWKLLSNNFPKQTKEYVPQIIALIHISENLDKYNFKNIKFKKRKNTKKVLVPRDKSIEYFAKIIDVDEDYLYSYNYALLKKRTPPNSDYYLNVPIDKIDKLYSFLNKTVAERIVIKYKIKKGDTLSSISLKFNNSIEDLIKLNDLVDSKIIAGKMLFVYSKQEGFIKEGDYYLHIVKKGDSLYLISKTYNVPVKKLKYWNNIIDSKIIIGQKIRVLLDESRP